MNTLASVEQGKTVEVKNIVGDDKALVRRLLDLGITPKTKVTKVRTAPFGDPIELSVRGYSLTM
ncbi:MAG: ferrous iron transport protein A, partial [Succinivibrio sp.]|nr:ferrous iron transport protein A [Succinivibrio sp.]